MSEQGSLDHFFSELASEGQSEGTAGFTLEAGKAREKLRKFALEHPENYFLMLVAGLYALGGRQFRLTLDADDLILDADLTVGRSAFEDLWAHVAGGTGKGGTLGFRLLAIAILTSVRFDNMVWSFQSSDDQGPWLFKTSVSKGRLGEDNLDVDPEPLEQGIRIWAKRKSMSQVTSRFLTRLTRKMFRRKCPEERLVAERVFLPEGGSFEVNGKAILALERQRSEATAILTSGQAPTLVSSPMVFQLKKSTSMLAILCNPEEPMSVGNQRSIHWIWNGLAMDTTQMEMPYPFCRVFVWAPTLRVDMSFSSLVDNRQRQALVREARDAVRELLKLFTLEMSAKLQGDEITNDFVWERMVIRKVLSNRVETNRNRHRFGSFNTALVDCPLFWGCKDDGTVRRYSLGDIWKLLEEEETVAAFTREQHWGDVPNWPDRPLVLYLTADEHILLERKFGAARLVSANRLAERLRRLSQPVEKEPWVDPDGGPKVCQGEFLVEGKVVQWSVSVKAAATTAFSGQPPHPGQLTVLKQGALYYQDESFLPLGLKLQVEADWQPNHLGHLNDAALKEQLVEGSLLAMAQHLSVEKVAPLGHTGVQTMLMLGLKERPGVKGHEILWQQPWMLCRRVDGSKLKVSPERLLTEMKELGAPIYYQEPESDLDTKVWPAGWEELLLLQLPGEARRPVQKWLEWELRSARGLKKMAGTASLRPPEGQPAWMTTVTEGLPEGVASVTLSWDRADSKRSALNVLWESFGRNLSRRFRKESLPGDLIVEWAAGWPDGTGCGISNKDQSTALNEAIPSLVEELAARFVEDASEHALGAVHPAGLAYALNQSMDDDPLFLRSDLTRVRASEYQVDGAAYYFQEHTLLGKVPPEAVYAPGDYAEYLSMLREDLKWERLRRPKAVQKPLRAPSQTKVALPKPKPKPSPKPAVAAEPPERPTPKAKLEALRSVREPDSELPEEERPRSTPEPKPEEVPAEVAPAAEPKPEPAETVQQPESESEVGGDDLDRPGLRLYDVLVDWPDFREVPHSQSFRRFLTKVELAEQDAPLFVSQGLVSVSPSVVARMEDPRAQLILLSALYSMFNRLEEEVTDREERQFHAMLLQRSLTLWPGRSLT